MTTYSQGSITNLINTYMPMYWSNTTSGPALALIISAINSGTWVILSDISTTTISATTFISGGYNTPGDLGTGAIYTSQGATSSGLLAVQDAVGTWFNLVPQPEMNVGYWGATGDGTTDDTSALQAAITYVCSQGTKLVFGNGAQKKFLISSALTIPFSQFFHLCGYGRGTFIIQSSNNTPIFSFTADLIHSWSITDFNLSWSTAQTSSDTESCGFWFTGGNYNRFNFQIERITFQNGFRSISNDPSVSALTWGCSIRDCVHNGSMTGGFFNGFQAMSVGQPNIKIDEVYINASNMVSSEPCLYLYTADSFSLDNIEVNAAVNGNLLMQAASSLGSIGTIKIESATYGKNDSIMLFQDSHVTIGRINLLTLTISASGGNAVGIALGGGACSLDIGQISLSFAMISGVFYLISSGSPPAFSCRLLGPPQGLIGTANAFLTNVGSAVSVTSSSVDAWQQPRPTGDNGDANSTWTIGSTNNIIQYLTELTADRTVTFEDQPAGADSNLYTGIIVKVVRNAGTPGAHNLIVQDVIGNILGTLASTNGMMEFTWQRFSWQLTNYSTWSGTTP